MKPSEVYEDFWLSMTHAREAQPGEEVLLHHSGEDSWTPWEAADGTLLMVYTSTRQELVALHNASVGAPDPMGAQYLRGWPWRILLDGLPPATSANRYPWTFPVKRPSESAA